jgi:hypothetical protein
MHEVLASIRWERPNFHLRPRSDTAVAPLKGRLRHNVSHSRLASTCVLLLHTLWPSHSRVSGASRGDLHGVGGTLAQLSGFLSEVTMTADTAGIAEL